MTSITSSARFTVSAPPHMMHPGLTDWHLYDDGERISPDRLANEANKLQRKVNELQEQVKMVIYLTDGDEILMAHHARDEAEIQQLNERAQDITDGELWWQPAVPRPKLPHEESTQEKYDGRTIQQ